VVLDDADLEAAVSGGVTSCYLNSGQTCSAHTRLLVPRERLREAEQIAAAAAAKATPGDPFEQGTRLGPLVSDAQRERVRDYIKKGEEEGAKLVTGGDEAPEGMERGYFVRPTVFSEVKPEMTIAQEEIFGPVLSIIPYDSEEEAVEIANGTRYGLNATVFTRDIERAFQAGRDLEVGGVVVNDVSAFRADQMPYGGTKDSGVGREGLRSAMDDYTEARVMVLAGVDL
jgi:acyl-CoA reductase-like NAD-dependent aldehyde dehydrogenase